SAPPDAVRMLIPSYLPNTDALAILSVCVESIQKYTPEPYEIWIIDNHSPLAERLHDIEGVNLALLHTEPLPPEARRRPWEFFRPERSSQEKWEWGSYANAIALEVGARLIDPATTHIMTMHM